MEIQRDIIDTFRKWKDQPGRKPLLLKGARQIGKTWAMERFGRECFTHVAKFDFDRQPELRSVFAATKQPERIVKELALYTDVPIVPGETLIIFDEIQACEEALNSLKYFCEDAPQYHIIAAGSLLGVAVRRRHMTVPVGKVSVVRMFPITFREFLRAAEPGTFGYVEAMQRPETLPEIILNKLATEWKRYLVCGGMPEAVACMLEGKGMAQLEATLQDILDLYELDFAKYAEPRDIPRIHALWHSLPAQLAKENRKFVFKVIRQGARSKDYEEALMWLEEAGMICRVYNITKPALPLAAYADTTAFKVYAADCGLLRRLAALPVSAVAGQAADCYTEFKGSMAENAVLQALLPEMAPDTPAYWSPDSRAEVEFVLQAEDRIVPVEVKAEHCVSGRSLTVYNEKYSPPLRVRLSMLNLQHRDGLLACPLPLAQWAAHWLRHHII